MKRFAGAQALHKNYFQICMDECSQAVANHQWTIQDSHDNVITSAFPLIISSGGKKALSGSTFVDLLLNGSL